MLVTQDGADSSEAKVFRAHAPPQGACENLVCALKQLANRQAGGDNLDSIFEGTQEQRRLKITNERRRFIKVDNHNAVKTGVLEKNTGVLDVVQPTFSKEPRGGGRIDPPIGRGENAMCLHQHHRCASHRSWTKTGTRLVRPRTWALLERSWKS